MSREKIIAVVGLSDEETAHLRLLMRKWAGELDAVWRWGSEDRADLLVVATDSFAGQMARMRAQTAGMRCAVFSSEPVDDADLLLPRPMQAADVRSMLNQASSGVARAGQIAPNTTDFYTRDIGDLAGAAAASQERDLRALPPAGPAAMGLDDMLRAEPIELRSGATRAPPAASGGSVLRPPATDARAAPHDVLLPAVASRHDDRQRVAPSVPAPSSKTYATRAAMLADTEPRPLRAYLEQDLLLRPARIVLPELAPLALDPKLKVLHSALGLGALEPYCRSAWRLCDWQALTTAELAELRAAHSAQPYSRLIWLDALLASNGHLASHLDPGGTYRLVRWIEIEKELSRYFRIASAMLQPSRLHEIAAASGSSMADVFDVVNAYDAVGLLEWQPRARRDDGAATSRSPFWRNPFGRK